MSIPSVRSVTLSLVLCAGACSTTTQIAGDGGSPEGGAVGPDGGSGADTSSLPSTCTDQTVAGTWDLIASGGGDQTTGTLTIDANTFVFSVMEKSLSFRADGPTLTLTWHDGAKSVPISTSRTLAAIDTGLLPLAVGGSWIFSSTSDSATCSATLGADSFTASCAHVAGTPFGTLDGTLTAQRTQKMASIFGELGGSWHLTGSGGGGVDATFSENGFEATLFGGAGDGSVNMKVCNGVASGSASNGVELSAQRR